jgi:hypothetical protein
MSMRVPMQFLILYNDMAWAQVERAEDDFLETLRQPETPSPDRGPPPPLTPMGPRGHVAREQHAHSHRYAKRLRSVQDHLIFRAECPRRWPICGN